MTPLGYFSEPRLDGINKVAIAYSGPLNPATVIPDIVSIEGRTRGIDLANMKNPSTSRRGEKRRQRVRSKFRYFTSRPGNVYGRRTREGIISRCIHTIVIGASVPITVRTSMGD